MLQKKYGIHSDSDLQVYVNDTVQIQVIINDTGNNRRRRLNIGKHLLQQNSKRAPYTIKAVIQMQVAICLRTFQETYFSVTWLQCMHQ